MVLGVARDFQSGARGQSVGAEGEVPPLKKVLHPVHPSSFTWLNELFSLLKLARKTSGGTGSPYEDPPSC